MLFRNLLFAFCVLGAGKVISAPQSVRIKGYLADSLGNPFEGSKDFRVSLYDVSTGGTSKWVSGVSTVVISSGRFVSELSGSTFVRALSSIGSAGAYFEIEVDADTADGAMTSPLVTRPRFRSSMQAFSLVSASTDRLKDYPVSTATPNINEVLKWDGTNWVGGSIAGVTSPDVVGPTSSILNALARFNGSDGKVLEGTSVTYGANYLTVPDTLTAGTVNVSGLTSGRLVRTSASRMLTSSGSTVTEAQLAYLVGVTAPIQTQLNSKQATFTLGNIRSLSAAIVITGATSAVYGAGVTLAVTTASASTNGILTSANWTTFNGKMAALTPGTANQVLRSSSAGGAPTWGAVAINQPNAVAGILPVANGGLGATTKVLAFKNLSMFTAKGDIHVHDGVTVAVLPAGASNEALTADSTAPNGVKWQAVSGGSGFPSGSIISFVGTSAPSGWLLCDGTSYSRTTYAALFAAIGTAWGTASGSTFNVPDLRGYFTRGVDGGVARDPDRASRTASATGGNTGDNVGSVQTDELASHSHYYSTASQWMNVLPTLQYGGTGYPGYSYTNSGSAGGNETRPVNINVNYIIKQ